MASTRRTSNGSILLPYPWHKDQHQLRNAEVLAREGAAKIVIDEADTDKTAKVLTEVLVDVIKEENFKKMSETALNLGKPEAARTVAQELLK